MENHSIPRPTSKVEISRYHHISWISSTARERERERAGGRLNGMIGLSLNGRTDILSIKLDSSIFRQSANPVCGFSMMEKVRLCPAWPTENWLFPEPHTGQDDCLRKLLPCFRKRMSKTFLAPQDSPTIKTLTGRSHPDRQSGWPTFVCVFGYFTARDKQLGVSLASLRMDIATEGEVWNSGALFMRTKTCQFLELQVGQCQTSSL